MAAFQQRRREQQRPQSDLSTASDDWPHLASPSSDDDEHPILLFNPPPPTLSALDDAQWSVLDAPRVRPTRTTSFTSSSNASTGTSGATTTTSGGDSPSPLAQASLLPAHDGSGVFAGAQRGGFDTASLIQSDVLLPSVYVDVDGASSEAAAGLSEAESSSFSRHRPSFLLRRDSLASSTFSSFAGSDFSSRASSSWALTEEALSTLPTSGAQHARGRPAAAAQVGTGRGAAAGYAADFAEDDDDGASAGVTSGSDEEGGSSPRPGLGPPSAARQAAVARAAAAQKQDDDDWAYSHLAMSAGIAPPSRRRGRPPPASQHSALGRSLVVGLGVAPLSPDIVSTALRALSPVSSSARSRTSSGYKRRHRRSGAGAREGETKKRSSVGAGAPLGALYGEYIERVMREEEERARRMQELLRVRKEEDEARRAQDKVLFGSAVRAYMSIEPSTLALIASPTPTASANPTPTPSRASSPMRPALHGHASFAHEAARELRLGVFDAAADRVDDAEAISDAETEVEVEHAHSTAAASPRAQAPAKKGWTSYSAAVPPATSLRAPEVALSPHRSHSASDLTTLAVRPLSRSMDDAAATTPGLGLVGLRPQPLRRRSSCGPSGATPSAPTATAVDLSRLSHEERILLAPSAAATASDESVTAWGGELDSFALALGYWKRLLRRLREGAGLSAHEHDCDHEQRGLAVGAAGEGLLVGGEGGVVRLVAAH